MLLPATDRLLRRALFQVHLWTGIVAGLYLFVVCVTGAALMFRIDMQRAAHPALFTPGAGPSAHPATVLEQVRDAFPRRGVLRGSALAPPSGLPRVSETRGMISPAVLVDPSSGESGRGAAAFGIRTLQELHFDLLAGRKGRIANGIGAVLL